MYSLDHLLLVTMKSPLYLFESSQNVSFRLGMHQSVGLDEQRNKKVTFQLCAGDVHLADCCSQLFWLSIPVHYWFARKRLYYCDEARASPNLLAFLPEPIVSLCFT